MEIREVTFTEDIYAEYLATINNVKFTPREIDVIACLLNARRTSQIASMLSIAPRTVTTHFRNIMLKLDCNSQEGIINFIEKSYKISLLREYYSRLVVELAFEKALKEISKLKREETVSCVIASGKDQGYEKFLVTFLEKQLTHVGIRTHFESPNFLLSLPQFLNNSDREKCNKIYILSESNDELKAASPQINLHKLSLSQVLVLLPKSSYRMFLEELKIVNTISLEECDNVYFLVFEVLHYLLPALDFEHIILTFKKQYIGLQQPSPAESSLTNMRGYEQAFSLSSSLMHENAPHLKSKALVLGALLLFISCIGYLTLGNFFLRKENIQVKQAAPSFEKQKPIYSDLIIPNEPLLLYRPHLMNKIEDKLTKDKGIHVVSLIGEGGAGKTTLARQYSRLQKAPLKWEFNAETEESLLASFEDLAYALTREEKDKKIWRELKETQDSKERAKSILAFVKKKLKSMGSWILLYDNINNFNDARDYVPLNPDVWGDGKVIITTRDKNIQNNIFINPQNVILVDELAEDEKYTLFSTIMLASQPSHHSTNFQDNEIKKLLLDIPSFPLDIITAAYYIKDTRISYQEYTKRIKELKEDFAREQECLLKEISNYTKTRYGIITIALDKIIKIDPNFKELLLFISFLDSQNIPKDLVESYKQKPTVEKFIRSLRKHSLITHETPLQGKSHKLSLSIHRNTQKIILAYLMPSFDEASFQKLVQRMAKVIENYAAVSIKHESSLSLRFLTGHMEIFLQNCNMLTHSTKADLMSKLGYIYLNIGEYNRAEHFLKESFEIYKNLPRDHSLKMAWTLKNLGELQIPLCRFKESKHYLEKSLQFYKKSSVINQIEIANVLKLLGDVHRGEGNLIEAENAVKQALYIFSQQLGEDSKEAALSLRTLGIINRNKGDFIKAHAFLRKSLEIHTKIFGKGHIKTSQISTLLGRNYRNLGYFLNAKDLLEKNLTIYEAYYGQNHVDTAETMFSLGAAFLDLGNILKAKKYCEKSWHIFKNYYGLDHLMTAEAAGYLGNTYRASGYYNKAREFLEYAHKIYKKNYPSTHIRVAQILQNLAEVYLLEGNLEIAEKLIKNTYKIFQEKKHSESYVSLELLAKLYIEKANRLQKQGNNHESKKFKELAISYMKKALAIVENHFTIISPHFIRIKAELNKIL